jgi:hypothetical protein
MNPFSYGTIVRGDNFYDRKEEKEVSQVIVIL